MEIQSAINRTKGLIQILKLARRFPTTETQDAHFLRLYQIRFDQNAALLKEKAPQ